MLTGRSWDALPFPGTFQNGGREELSKVKIGNYPIPAHNYHTSTIIISKYMFFWGSKHNEIGFEQLTQHKKCQNRRWPPISRKFISCPKE